MQRSDVPPPEARRFDCQGHHAIAFTAAVWRSKSWRGEILVADDEVGEEKLRQVLSSQTKSLLSFAPEAKYLPSVRRN
jgi:hypothetical protein